VRQGTNACSTRNQQLTGVQRGIARHHWAWSGILCATICATLFLFQIPAYTQEHRTTVPFHTAKNDASILIEANIEGQRRVLVLDTGARFTIINSTPKAKCEASADVTTAFGPSTKFCAADVELALGNHQEHRLILFGPMPGFDGTGVDGVLGMDVLRASQAIRIDFKAQTVTLEE